MPTVLATNGRRHQLWHPIASTGSACHARVWSRRPFAPFSLSLSATHRARIRFRYPTRCSHHAHHARNRWPPSPAASSNRKHGLGWACKVARSDPFPQLSPDLSLCNERAPDANIRGFCPCNLVLSGRCSPKLGMSGWPSWVESILRMWWRESCCAVVISVVECGWVW
jgi:hypothetical protein